METKVMGIGRDCIAACLEEGTVVVRNGRFEICEALNDVIYVVEVKEPCPNCGFSTPLNS